MIKRGLLEGERAKGLPNGVLTDCQPSVSQIALRPAQRLSPVVPSRLMTCAIELSVERSVRRTAPIGNIRAVSRLA